MNPQELAKSIKARKPLVVIDVRSGFEYRSGHIPSAIHAPTWKILFRLANLPSDKDTQLVVTCEHGPRAQLAKTMLAAFGHRNVVLLEGHMAGWRRGRLPQER